MVTVAADDGIRPTTTADKLGKLKPVFKKGGSTTAGNSSQVSDGAAACLVMRKSKADALGLTPMGVLRSYAVVGVPPEIMGIGPAEAIPVAVAQANLSLGDIDVFEINEAFASQAAFCVDRLKVRAELFWTCVRGRAWERRRLSIPPALTSQNMPFLVTYCSWM